MKPILIIGGGISGITTAVELAEVGREVILVEKEPYLGGNVAKMNNYFPKLCPPACGLEINFRRIRQNSRIQVLTSTELVNLSGSKGNYTANLQQRPQYITNNCTSCGKCAEVCPVDRPDAFNYNLTKTKVAYISQDLAYPNKYTIDDNYCSTEACGKCLEVCDYGAIDLKAQSKQFDIEAEAVIVATGWGNYPATNISEYHYAEFKNVVTNVEFERLISPSGIGGGALVRPSDNTTPKNIVFVQCVGSRDENHLPYCSAVCCSASLKHALSIQEQYPDSKVKIFYIDLRVAGRNEDFLVKVQANKNIELIKGKVAKVEEIAESGNLIVEAEDILAGKKSKHEADLVVLATGIVPKKPDIQSLSLNMAGFLDTEQENGVIPVACCKKPLDVSSSVKEATAAALKSLQLNN